MYDAVAAIEGGLAPFATECDRASGRVRRRRGRAGCHGTSSSPASRRRRRPSRSAYDTFMASITDGPAKDGGKAVGAAAAAGMLAMRTGDHFDDVVPVRPADAGAGRLRADRADAAGRHQAAHACVRSRYDSPSDYRPGRARYELTQQALRAGRGRGAGRSAASTALPGQPAQTEHGPLLHRPGLSSSTAALVRGLVNAARARSG